MCPFKAYHLVGFSMFIKFYSHYQSQPRNMFIIPKRDLPIGSHSPFTPLLSPGQPLTYFLSGFAYS